MEKAPEEVIKAVLDTLKYAMVYCRNYTLSNEADIALINELMEAIHDLPSQLYNWSDDGIERINLHLSCFECRKWNGAPDLNVFFKNAYDRAKGKI